MVTRLVAGTRLGRYELLCPIGSGGMAAVWTARMTGSRGFERIVAVKVLLPFLASDPEMQRLFTQEAEISASIRHPNVCPVYDLGEAEGTLYMAMEWIDGDTVGSLLTGGFGPVRPEVAARIVADASAGLAGAFGARTANGEYLAVLHRDISPNNILISSDGVVKLSDFGIAKILSARKNADFSVVRGKPSYMSPERASGRAHDHRSDVYSLGCVFFELLTGETLRNYVTEDAISDGTMRLLGHQNTTAVSPLSGPVSRNAGVDGELVQILIRATSSHADNRFSTAEELRFALETWLSTRGQATSSMRMVVETLRSRVGSRIEARRAAIRDAAASIGRADSSGGYAPVPPSQIPTIPPAAPRQKMVTVPPAAPRAKRAPPPQRTSSVLVGFGGGFLAVAMITAFFLAFSGRSSALKTAVDAATSGTAVPTATIVATVPVASVASVASFAPAGSVEPRAVTLPVVDAGGKTIAAPTLPSARITKPQVPAKPGPSVDPYEPPTVPPNPFGQ